MDLPAIYRERRAICVDKRAVVPRDGRPCGMGQSEQQGTPQEKERKKDHGWGVRVHEWRQEKSSYKVMGVV